MKKIIIILTALILILITCYTGYFFSLYKEVLTRNFSDNIIQEVCTSNIGEGDKLENYVYIYIDNEKKYEIYYGSSGRIFYDSTDFCNEYHHFHSGYCTLCVPELSDMV